jgi:hypothetical protein
MFPLSDWTVITEMVSLVLVLTRLLSRTIVTNDIKCNEKSSLAKCFVFVAVLEGDTVNRGPIRRVKP